MIRTAASLIGILMLTACAEPATFEAAIEDFQPVDDTHIRITATFDNNGNVPTNIRCGITLKENPSVVDQDEISSDESVPSKGSREVTRTLRIELSPAEVREIEVKSCSAV